MAQANEDKVSGDFWKAPDFKNKVADLKERADRENRRDESLSATKPPEVVEDRVQFILDRRGRGSLGSKVDEAYEQKYAGRREEIRRQVMDDVAAQLRAKGQRIDDAYALRDYIARETESRLSKEQEKSPYTPPIPGGKRRLPTQTVQAELEASMEAHIRDKVKQDVKLQPTYVHGATPEQVNKYVEEKVKAEMAKYKQPRYVMTADGRPFYLSKEDERTAYEQSLEGETEGRKKWLLLKYDAANAIARSLVWLGEPSLKIKEALTDTDIEGNVAGSLAQLGLNVAFLAGEHVAAFLTSTASEEQVARFRREAEAAKYTDPMQAEIALSKAERLQKQIDFHKTTAERISVARAAVRQAWEDLNREAKEVPASFKTEGPRNDVEARRAYVQTLLEKRDQAQQEAKGLRAQALTAYSQGNYDQAVDLIKQAQDADRRGDPADSYGAYTWIREPERYNKFIEDAALIEIQKGAPLTPEEIRRLKDYHTNGWVEMAGELIFDPLNVLPSSVMEAAFKIPLSTTKKAITKVATKIATEAPEIARPIAKTIDILGSPIRWLRRESINSVGNRINITVNNLFDRVGTAYTTTDDLVKAVDEIGDVILDAKRATDQAAAEAIFNSARERVPGLQNITFRQFKTLMDAGDTVDPTQWGKMLSNSLGSAEDYLTQVAARRNVVVSEVLSDVSKKRFALQDVAVQFQRAYIDPRRIYKGSTFTEDTISGWVTKTLRELSGQEVNELVKAHKLDEVLIKYGETLGPTTKALAHELSGLTEKVLHVAAIARDVWSTMVLTTQRFIVGNFIDTSMRDVVWGGNLFDDIGTLLTSTHRTFVDELGMNPVEFSQALSRIDLDFTDNVTNRLVYENWRPGANPFAFWAYEFQRLKATDAQLAKHNILAGMLGGLPDGKFKNAIFWLGDGMSMTTPAMLYKTTAGAVADFNTAIEFTFRLRMFHREYFKLLNTLEPSFLARGLEGLSPATREIAQQIWKLSEGNPRRLSAYVDSIVGKATKGTPAQWALTVPNNIEQVTRGMDAVDRQLFVSQVRAALDDTIQASLRSGKELDATTFNKFFDDYKVKLQDEIQAHMSQVWDKRQAENVLGKDGVAVTAPDASDLKGSAPIPAEQSPRNLTIEAATKRLRKSNRFSKITDVAENFEAAVIDYAKVQRVPGDGVRLVSRGGERIIELGDNALKGKTTKLYEQLHDVVLQVLKGTDTEAVLRGGFSNMDEYENVVRRFINSPADVLAKDERQFLTIADQLTAHPQLKELLARTSKEFDYAKELEVYKNFSRYDDAYGFTRPPEEILQEMANEKIVVPGAHVAASHDEVIATRKLGELYTATPTPAEYKPFSSLMTELEDRGIVPRKTWELNKNNPKDFPVVWRSMSEHEYKEILRSGEIQSKGAMNFADQNAVKATFYDATPSRGYAEDTLLPSVVEETRKTIPDFPTPNEETKVYIVGVSNEGQFQLNNQGEFFTTSPVSKDKIQYVLEGKRVPIPEMDELGVDYAIVQSPTMPKPLSETARVKIGTFIEQWDAYRKQLRQFWTFADPGPKTLTAGEARRKAWDSFYNLGTEAYQREAKIKNDLVKLFETDPAAAEKLIDDAQQNFADYFLKENGIEVTWDADRNIILNTKVTRNGKSKNLTARLDNAAVESYFYRPQIQKEMKANPVLRVDLSGQQTIKASMSQVLRDTFQMPTDRAEAWTRVIDNHAQKWAQETGQPVEAYYERLGFQRFEGGLGIGQVRGNNAIRLVKRGAINRDANGKFIFYGLGHSNFESMVRETGELFYDDLVSMAEHSNQAADDLTALRSYIENKTGKKIIGGILNQEQSQLFTEMFTRYVAEGIGPDIKLKKSFEKFKTWLNGTFEAVHTAPLGTELSDDIYRTMDRMFIESKIMDVPQTNNRTIRLMAQEAGLDAEDEAGLLKRINESVNPTPMDKSLPPELQGQRDALQADVNRIADELDRMTEGVNMGYDEFGNSPRFPDIEAKQEEWDKATKALADFDAGVPDQIITQRRQLEQNLQQATEANAAMQKRLAETSDEMRDAFMQGYGHEVRNLELDLADAQKALDDFDATVPRAKLLQEQKSLNDQLWSAASKEEAAKIREQLGKIDETLNPIPAYHSLGDVPKDVAARALGTPESPAVSKVVSEIDEAWQVWKTSRQLKGFPEEALQSPDTFKAYLKDRIAGEWNETAQQYNRILWEVETFENAMLNYHSGQDMATHLFPRIPETEISDGMKTWVRNNDEMVNNYESALRALDEWKVYMDDVVTNGHPSATLTKEQLTELNGWSARAASDKAEMIDIMLKGGTHKGRDIEGAIDKVNRVMLDYQHRSVFDQFMKNFFPFWMFPSRSFPFWVETMATHPQLIANYEKIQRLSRTQRYQMGAITSTGKPLPSLDGYIPIPGTDLWFNPLAPFSFRYALDVAKAVDNIIYQANTAEEDVEPKAFMVKEFMQTSQIYGFSVAPWMTFLLKEAYNIPDEVLPRYPLLPQISLIPRWMVPDMIRIGNKTITTHKDQWYPEASWHDYMVERSLLEDALSQIRNGNLSEAEKLALMSKTQDAIKNKGDNPLWQQGYKDLTNSETERNWGSFFTGFYAKPFTDGQAEILKLRNELNLLKSSLNNEFQSNIFELPEDADAAWQNYLNRLDTPDGWAYRLYTDIGWVRNDLGQQVSDPKERAKYLALKIEQDENQQLYYQRMSDLQEEYNKRLRALPVGAAYDQMKPVWDWYANERESLQYLRSFEQYYGTNKPVELIQRDFRNDWFKAVNETKPRWNVTDGETYDQYQARVADWQKNLPTMAPLMMRIFIRRQDVMQTRGALKPDQQLDPAFFAALTQGTTIEGLNAWEIENDDIFDALNKGWKDLYWDKYWNSGVLEGGYKADLAEKDFYTKNPNPPDAEQLYAWIQQTYGDRFTLDEVKKWVDGADIATVESRTLSTKDNPQDYQMRQEVWDMLSWLGPGGRNREVFDDAFAANGGDPDWLTTWYQESGQAYTTKPETLQEMYDALKVTIRELQLKPPTRAELVRYVHAQEENDKFKTAVERELGESFYDLLDYYNNLDTKAKKEFQGEQSTLYEAIDSYQSMREAYAEEHPLWAEYFGLELESTVKSKATDEENIAPVYSAAPNPRKRKKESSGKPTAMSYVPRGGSKPAYSGAPQFGIQSRITSSFSPQFLQTIGTKLTWEVSQLYSTNRRLSVAAVGFLNNLSARHPEWQQSIRDILARNGS